MDIIEIILLINPKVFTKMLTLTGPVAQKVAYEVVLRRFQGEGVEFFFISDLTNPPQNFDAHLLENTILSPSSFHFSVGFYIKICFESDGFIAYPNE